MIRFAELVTLGELKQFWTAYQKRNVGLFKCLMEEMTGRVGDYATDKRTKELLLDCYMGAVSAPEDVLGSGLIDWDSPNVTSVVMFIHELHKLFDGRGISVDEVVHDSQQQYGLSIEDAYRILHQVRIIWNIAEFSHKQVTVFSPTFYTCESQLCDGLQVADVFLYVHKKALSGNLEGGPMALHNAITSRLHCLYMTREGLWSETELTLMGLYSKPLKRADFVRGAELMHELESKRKARLLDGQKESGGDGG
jgi:hypothetical protein